MTSIADEIIHLKIKGLSIPLMLSLLRYIPSYFTITAVELDGIEMLVDLFPNCVVLQVLDINIEHSSTLIIHLSPLVYSSLSSPHLPPHPLLPYLRYHFSKFAVFRTSFSLLLLVQKQVMKRCLLVCSEHFLASAT